MNHNTAAIRKLLIAAFTDGDLTAFCFDHFREVHDKFGRGLNRTEKIQLLLEYCEINQSLDKLLELVRTERPVQYQRFSSQLVTASPPASSTPRLSLARLPNSREFLFGREAELAQLDAAWADSHTNLFSLVAWGGVGKTALVNHWLQRLAAGDTYRGVARVYAWSFYSQGA
ncbi:MAG: hypothetical protein HYR94_00625, partial [Chloroflexi bacterium]|nr:hypothetical protein [Chloroflexota bacterium]